MPDYRTNINVLTPITEFPQPEVKHLLTHILGTYQDGRFWSANIVATSSDQWLAYITKKATEAIMTNAALAEYRAGTKQRRR